MYEEIFGFEAVHQQMSSSLLGLVVQLVDSVVEDEVTRIDVGRLCPGEGDGVWKVQFEGMGRSMAAARGWKGNAKLVNVSWQNVSREFVRR